MTPRDSPPLALRGDLGVPGFRATGIRCGIKPDALDLALIASDRPATVAGVFTRSTVIGAPVELCRARVRTGRGRCVVVNSGIANVAMGDRGRRDAAAMAAMAAAALDCPEEESYVASTGVIGSPLPMARLRSGIPQAAKSLRADGLQAAAEAIRTTDTFAKIAAVTVQVQKQTVTVAGIAKGSGMIEPNMATMLGFLLTDAVVSPTFLRGVLRRAAERTFNRVTVDGETSTSDTVLLFANGAAGNARLTSRASGGATPFEHAVTAVAEHLARDLARDGEGATKLVTVVVTGAANEREADRAARRIANSMLVKTAIFGQDPNWGRILQTLGAGRISICLERTEIELCGVRVFRDGSATGAAARRRAAERLAAKEVELHVSLGVGDARAEIWTCDLSYDYVRINAEYTT